MADAITIIDTAVRIGTNRRPLKKPRKVGSVVRWKRCHSSAATRPATMPPSTPKSIVACSPFESSTPGSSTGDSAVNTPSITR